MALFQDINHFLSVVLLAIAALFPIVDPLGGAPIYLAMVSSLTPADRARTARLVAINSFFLLAVSVLIGAYVLDIFGVSIPAVQVGGGLIVCAIGWSFLMAPESPAVSDRISTPDADVLTERAFYPLTMPLTVGPGSISVAITLGANPPRGLRSLFTTALAHVIGVFIVAVSIYLCYRYADRILNKLGRTGTNVLIRLSAFILFCIGVQIVWNGLRTLLATVLPGAVDTTS
ncbi:MAG TPA: MarC family protein [Steroidobacteraceae bacterium]|jgi:multiple antibiotic resistance protein|nr:MarC family protein [Steroidobacteraceae bacterium]